MRAWVCHSLTGLSGLHLAGDWPDAPAPGPGEVTVRIDAAALNFPDLLMLSGGYQYRPEPPFVPGMEAAGHIVAAGEALAGDLEGARVMVGARGGCLAERITVAVGAVRPVPERLSQAQAAAHTVGALTAWVGLERGRLRAGERLLVLGAGSGVGLPAVAIGRHLGAHVTAAASSEAKLAPARAAGADAVLLIDRAAPDLGAAGAVDMVYDPVGGALFMPALKVLGWGGRYVVIGFAGGMPAPVPVNRLLLKGTEIIGVRAGEQGRRVPGSSARTLAAIDALAADGVLTPHIGLSVPFDRADAAFAVMAAGTLTGKAVVEF